jgi:peptide/nickel transport system permease protein
VETSSASQVPIPRKETNVAKFVIQRFIIMIVMLAALSLIVFITIELPPGDYADRRALHLRSAGVLVTNEDVESLRHTLGLDRPWYVRYWNWITNIVLHGNFGQSFGLHLPVTEVLGQRVGLTVLLAVATIIFTYGLAIPIGIYSAIRQYSPGDYLATFIGYFGMATPSFMLALILLYFSVMVFDTSVGGLFSPEYAEAPWSWGKFVDLLRHLWVPALVLGLAGTAFEIRTMRATLLDEKNKLYVTAARAKGLPEWKLLLKYPVRVALNPIVSTIGWELTAIIAGAPLVSFVLALPDTGPLFLTALLDQDTYLSGAILLMYAALTILGTFLSDILLALLDPRIRYGERI